MRTTLKWTLLTAALFTALSCAATTGENTAKPVPGAGKPDIAALDRAIGQEKDPAALSELIFDRGHAYLEAAESFRERQAEGEATGAGGIDFPGLLLRALWDFENVANNHPQSAEAPEALFHMGIIYDYPNLSSFKVAIHYYNSTIERYPGTESARKAKLAIEEIRSYMHELEQGAHGL
jgi:hypothetical protein